MFWYPHSRAFSNPSAAASTGRTLLSPFPAPAYAPAMNMAMARDDAAQVRHSLIVKPG